MTLNGLELGCEKRCSCKKSLILPVTSACFVSKIGIAPIRIMLVPGTGEGQNSRGNYSSQMAVATQRRLQANVESQSV